MYYMYIIILKVIYLTSLNGWYTNQHFGNFCGHFSHDIKIFSTSVFERMGLSHVCLDKHIQMPKC